MDIISLNGSWNGACICPGGEEFAFSASVPGSAINDLISCGRLPEDIFYGKNADSVRPYEDCTFHYTRTFSCSPAGCKCTLSFERLDTYCDVWLNGIHLGYRENGNIAHAFDVTDAVHDGENTLEVRFYSPTLKVAGKKSRPGAFTTERLHTRRMQCTYGWDWVARFLTCGIPGEVTLEMSPADEMKSRGAYIYTRIVDEDGAQVGIDASFENFKLGRIVDFEILSPSGESVRTITRFVSEPMVRLSVDIPSPELWYPLGYGAQPLYTLVIRHGENVLHEEKFGVRTVRILQLPDVPGSAAWEKCLSIKNPDYDFNDSFSGFILKVNGTKIMCKGANWVPCEPFATGDIREKITRTLTLARDAGVNMLRIWGGGRFEIPHFYDECSRLGIMVTQDFLMACGNYPEEEEWFISQLRAEAEYAARLLRNKPCLMWWSGDNENAVNGCDTDENYMGRRSAYDGIFPVLAELDPHRDFLPSSPYGGKKYASNTVGTTHNTQYLGEFLPWIMGDGDLSDYKEKLRDYRARFTAEEPQLGAVCLETLRTFMTDDDIFGESDDMWLFHTQTNPALPYELFEYMRTFARKLFGGFADPRDRYFKYEYLQYEWLRISLEQARREKWFTSGVIFWMLNDCWPAAAGWALLDYYNRPKAAYYSFRRAAAPLLASVDGPCVYAVNDSPEDMSVAGCVYVISADRTQAKPVHEFTAHVPAGESVIAARADIPLAEGEFIVADIKCGENSSRGFWRPGGLPLAPAEITWEYNDGTFTVQADKYVHAVELPCGLMPEDNYFSLLPGEKCTVRCQNPGDTDIPAMAWTIS